MSQTLGHTWITLIGHRTLRQSGLCFLDTTLNTISQSLFSDLKTVQSYSSRTLKQSPITLLRSLILDTYTLDCYSQTVGFTLLRHLDSPGLVFKKSSTQGHPVSNNRKVHGTGTAALSILSEAFHLCFGLLFSAGHTVKR